MRKNHRKNGVSIGGPLAKSHFFRKPQFACFPESCHERIPMKIIFGQLQHVPPRMTDQPRGQHQKICTNRFDRCRPVLSWQAESTEPMHQVAREKHELKKRHVGHPVSRGNLAQRQIVKQLADVFLDDGAWLIKFPDPPGFQIEIGDKHAVAVAPVLEERQMFGLDRVFGYWTTHYHEAASLRPAMSLVSKLGHLESAFQLVEARRTRAAFDRAVLLGYDNIAQALFFQASDELAAEESRVGPNTNARPSNVRRH